ncbi:MAG: hypothetical protein WBD22_12335 [Pyrinomonadaceae bacterium]
MKLATRAYTVALILLTFVFALTAQVDNDARSAKDDRNTAPTVGTGGPVGGPTGLFTVYDGQTLRRGEFTFSAAWSNYDRDPGNVDISEVPVSFQVGLTNNFELFFNTDAYRAVKVNSPRNLSGFYLPNSQVFINGANRSAPAIVLSPQGPGVSQFPNQAIFRPTGAPFTQYPYIGGSIGTLGFLPPFFSGPVFGFPAGTNALLGPATAGGNGADNYPGIGSVYGSILPGVVLTTNPLLGAAGQVLGEAPGVFTLAPSYLNDAPFLNRTFGESAFNTFTVGGKWRWTNINSPIGVGLIGYYRFYADNADDFSGFNQLQRGSSPGGDRGDFGAVLFADARVKRWMNLSANIGYNYNSQVKDANGNVMLDRGDEVLAALAADFPVNKFFQPIIEFRTLQYVGGRTPNAFENNPMDGLAGFRVFPARWFGLGFAYRHHFNPQDRDNFDDNDSFTATVTNPCHATSTNCTTQVITTNFTGIPQGFNTSTDPHGFILQTFIGRRDERQEEIENKPANVTDLTVSDAVVYLPCAPGFRSTSGGCSDTTSLNISTTASDPENDVLTYNYTVSGGRIVGQGANVSWDLSGVQKGTYTITSGVDDGCGICGQTQTKTITIEECADCVKICECPTITVSGPAGITAPGGTMTFTANVSGGSQDSVTYNWSVSAGEITSGQGTTSITVAVPSEMSGGDITATIDVGGTDPSCGCDTSWSASGPVDTKPTATQTDEFGPLSNDEIRARLDAFFATLANDPNAQGYIINYGTNRQIAARERLIQNHINFRNFDRSRVTLVQGGDLGTGASTKLYTVPPGADNPTP